MDKYFRFFNLPGSFVLTVFMSLLAIVLALIFRTTDRRLCLCAMLLSSVGDIFLMNFRNLSEWVPNYFYVGAGFFMAAHIFYILTFHSLIKAGGYSLINPGFFVALVLGAAAFLYFTMNMTDKTIYALAIVYLVIITANCSVIFSYAWSSFSARPLSILAAAGALSFFLSDAIIGLGKLMDVNQFNYLIWWLYPIGQILLIIAA